jgi:hypothetical protein
MHAIRILGSCKVLSKDTRRWIYYTSATVTAKTFLLLTTNHESQPTKLLSQKLGQLGTKYHKKLEPRDNPDAVPNGRALAELVLLWLARLAVTEPIAIMVSLLSATA